MNTISVYFRNKVLKELRRLNTEKLIRKIACDHQNQEGNKIGQSNESKVSFAISYNKLSNY